MAGLIDILLKEDKINLEALIKDTVNIQIKNSIGVDNVDVIVDDIKISKFRQLIAKTLLDERSIDEYSEINRTGGSNSRSVSIGDVELFSYKRKDYTFANEGNEKEFRVDKSTNTRNCSRCQGRRKNRCYTCDGARKVRCSNCSNGQIKCSSCDGTSKKYCWSCSGSGRTTSGYGDDKRTVNCSSCGGQGNTTCGSCVNGYNTCSSCGGTTMVKCSTCRGAGDVPCRDCDAQGTFNDFFVVTSEIIVKSNHQFLDLNPDGEFVKTKISEDEFNYSKSYSDYKLANLKEFNAELKTLTKGIGIVKEKQAPLKVNFSIHSCAALSFNIKIGSSTYIGGLKDGKLWYDDSFLQFLFYDILDGVPIESDFNKITNLKKPLVNQIEGFEDAFTFIAEYKKFENIINLKYSVIQYFDSTGKKIISTRNIQYINTELYLKHLYKKFTFKFAILAVFWCIPFFIFTTAKFEFTLLDIPNYVSLGGALFSVIVARLVINKKSPTNAMLKGLLVLIIAFAASFYLSHTQQKEKWDSIANCTHIERSEVETAWDIPNEKFHIDFWENEHCISITKIIKNDEYSRINARIKNEEQADFYIKLAVKGSTISNNKKGVILFLEDKSIIELPNEKIECTGNEYNGYVYASYILLNKEQIATLKDKKVNKFKSEIYEIELSENNSYKIKTYINCMTTLN